MKRTFTALLAAAGVCCALLAGAAGAAAGTAGPHPAERPVDGRGAGSRSRPAQRRQGRGAERHRLRVRRQLRRRRQLHRDQRGRPGVDRERGERDLAPGRGGPGDGGDELGRLRRRPVHLVPGPGGVRGRRPGGGRAWRSHDDVRGDRGHRRRLGRRDLARRGRRHVRGGDLLPAGGGVRLGRADRRLPEHQDRARPHLERAAHPARDNRAQRAQRRVPRRPGLPDAGERRGRGVLLQPGGQRAR